MHVIELQCPHCSTRLRLRDQKFVGRVVHCPDCAAPLAIVRTAAGVIEALPYKAASPIPAAATHDTGSSSPRESASETALTAGRISSALTPRRIAWGLAALLTLGVVVFVLTGDAATNPPAAPQADTIAQTEPVPAVEPAPQPAASEDQAVPAAPQPQGPKTLAEWVIAYRDRHGCYPVENPLALAVPEHERLGWLAAVAAEREPSGPQPHWDLTLHDPANSRFVRRRIDPFLTSHGPAAAGGLPATHYVGVAGVGADAPGLPKVHPRAGIFGLGRRTTVEDVRDGTSNTLIIVSAVPQPSPWAAGALATIRAFTAEPYVNGPDGFGHGEGDGLSVALADGSVKVLSSETDPRIVRRLAAMADGLPLDPNIPGEPGDSTTTTTTTQIAGPGGIRPAQPAVPADAPVGADIAAANDDAKPIEPQLAPERRLPQPVSYDVDAALAQPIASFDQRRAVPLKTLLADLQEMAGVPITHDGIDAALAEALLKREFTLQQSDTTVGGLLTELLRKAGLNYVADRTLGIRIVPSESPSP